MIRCSRSRLEVGIPGWFCFGGGRDKLPDSIHISVAELGRRTQFRNMAWRWTDVEEGDAQRTDVVDLARMDDAYERVTHRDDVQVGGRERGGKFLYGLVGNAPYVRQSASFSEIADFAKFRAPADEAEDNIGAVLEAFGGF